jgi:hypothetical protein
VNFTPNPQKLVTNSARRVRTIIGRAYYAHSKGLMGRWVGESSVRPRDCKLKERGELKWLAYLMLRLIQKDKSVMLIQSVIRNMMMRWRFWWLSFQAL